MSERTLDCPTCKRPTQHALFLTSPLAKETRIAARCGECGHTLTYPETISIDRAKSILAGGDYTLQHHPKGAHRPR